MRIKDVTELGSGFTSFSWHGFRLESYVYVSRVALDGHLRCARVNTQYVNGGIKLGAAEGDRSNRKAPHSLFPAEINFLKKCMQCHSRLQHFT